jgi:hypothetical protein
MASTSLTWNSSDLNTQPHPAFASYNNMPDGDNRDGVDLDAFIDLGHIRGNDGRRTWDDGIEHRHYQRLS